MTTLNTIQVFTDIERIDHFYNIHRQKQIELIDYSYYLVTQHTKKVLKRKKIYNSWKNVDSIISIES